MIQPLPSTSPWLPLWTAPAQDPSRKVDPLDWRRLLHGSALLRDKRIVIVEDEGLTQIQLRKICLLAGMEVVGLATDGEQGVEQVLLTQPDMVLMDIKMPILDGLNAAERILQELSVCVVMLTAYDLDDYKAQAQAIGACGYVFKPVSASSLIPQLEAAYTVFQRKPA
ncbi:MAG: transcriptional regulator [Chthonomonadales bacterium]|nr:transcriptional regulator [Chthonomonadales bacterium]